MIFCFTCNDPTRIDAGFRQLPSQMLDSQGSTAFPEFVLETGERLISQ
jgi:hypothetical protein